MSTGFIIQTAIEVILVIAVVIMLLNEDKMIAFEDEIKKDIKEWFKKRKSAKAKNKNS